MEKSAATTDEPKGRGASNDKGEKTHLGTREVIDLDPKLMPLRSQRDILDYIAKNDVKLPDKILVEWCPLKTNVMVSPQ